MAGAGLASGGRTEGQGAGRDSKTEPWGNRALRVWINEKVSEKKT